MEQQRRVSNRLSAIAESATLKVDAKAKALKAEGRPVIGFGAGEPDFATPRHIVDAAVAACQDPANHKYSPAGGLPELKKAICDSVHRVAGRTVEPNQVLVTNGGKQAVFMACAVTLDEGDECILPAPYWTTYPEAIKLAGGVPVEVLAGMDQGFCVTVEQLEAARTERTRALVLCSPSNPTGAAYPEEELRAIAAWAVEHGIWVIADEIYDHLLYDGAKAPSLPALCPEVADQTIVVNGVAKTYAMTGWRVGWMVGPVDAIKAATNFQSHATSNVANVSQRAALQALAGPQDALDVMHEAFARRRATMLELLRSMPGVEVLDPQGAFYCFPSVQGLIGRTLGGRQVTSSADLAEILLDEVEVAVVPGEAFGAPGFVRLSYALGDDALREGLTRIKGLLEKA